MNIAAIVWDYDGTLVDSSHKNLEVTKELLPDVVANFSSSLLPTALTSIEKYRSAVHETTDWRQLYSEHFGLTPEETESAGPLWTKYQEMNQTKVELFPGIAEIIMSLPKTPHAICSQNCSIEIIKFLESKKLGRFFDVVLGYRDAGHIKPKPHPQRLLYCLEKLHIDAGNVLYIGDHIEDMWFVRDTRISLQKIGSKINLITVAACYAGANPNLWGVRPDHIATSVAELKTILESQCL